MIPTPPGFTARLDGGTLVYERAGDDLVLRYTERQRPVLPIEALWGDAVPSLGPPERLVTDEGEYAWLVEGARDDERGHLTRFLGAVVGDDFLAVLEATTAMPGRHEEIGELVEQLLVGDRHMLGVRRRPYWHDAPGGCIAEQHGPFYTYYRVPEADLVVYVPPAIPRDALAPGAMLGSLGLVGDIATTPVHAPLSGALHVAVADRYRAAFVLEDATYAYAALVDAPVEHPARAEGVLAEILASIEGLPRNIRAIAAAVPMWLAY